jgi:hypothetical protein
MLNTTEKCRCGGEKKENQQWCAGCWEAIPIWRKNEFISAYGRMEYTIKAANISLEVEQPAL